MGVRFTPSDGAWRRIPWRIKDRSIAANAGTFGGGHHRVYFALGNPLLDNPVMNGACPQCGHGLPDKNRP